jgi:putative endonuclease
VGVTADLLTRVNQHKQKDDPGCFTAKYNLNKLVYFELFDRIEFAIEREKQLKGGSRKTKIKLIEKRNPFWADLWNEPTLRAVK